MKRQPENKDLGYSDTPVLPDTGYHVHDGERPQPPVVTPGEDGAPPSDAVVLFDGTNLDGWQSKDGGPAGWNVENGYMEVVKGAGEIRTKRTFGDVQLHLEFATPSTVEGSSQGRGNSGVFLMGRYEIQVLDNYDNPTYSDGTVGAIYGQYPPLANAVRRPGEWNTYDIIWEAPRWNANTQEKPAFVTVILNGVVLHHRKELLGPTGHKNMPTYEPHPPEGPLALQDHGNPVRFRNIWARRLGAYDE